MKSCRLLYQPNWHPRRRFLAEFINTIARIVFGGHAVIRTSRIGRIAKGILH